MEVLFHATFATSLTLPPVTESSCANGNKFCCGPKITPGGFGAGMFGVVLNCWCDVTRTIIQKEAIQATFDPASKRVTWAENLNVFSFFAKAGQIAGRKLL